MRTVLVCLSLLFLGVPAMAGTTTALGSGQYLTTVPKQCGGTLYCWGWNSSGTIGDGTTTDKGTPTAVKLPDGVTSFTQVSTSGWAGTTCALTPQGKAYCWGSGINGTIGDGTKGKDAFDANAHPTPTAVLMPKGVEKFTQISSGAGETCAIADNKRIYCWGIDRWGEIGQGKPFDINAKFIVYPTPMEVAMPKGLDGFTFVSASRQAGAHACAIGTDGHVYCWGWSWHGQIGDGISGTTKQGRTTPTSVTMPTGVKSFTSVSTSGVTACAIADNGKAYCWGANGGGQIGDGTREYRSVPTAVIMPTDVSAFKSIAVGGFLNTYPPYTDPHIFGATTCAIADNGKAYCWGDNRSNEVGNGTPSEAVTKPTQVAMPAGVNSFSSITNNGYSTCAVGDDGNAYCWGRNTTGLYEDLGKFEALPPTRIPLPDGVTKVLSIDRRQMGACIFAQ